MKITRFLPFLAVTLAALPAHAQSQTLYDGTQQTTISAQNWLFLSFPAGAGTEMYNTAEQSTTFTTADKDNSARSGYTRNDKTLSTSGFALNFTLRINSEAHSSNDRAGVSLIALNENKRGVELGFWTDRIQIQDLASNTFTFDPNEFAAVSTTSLIPYTLTFTGTTYTLASNNTTLMSGLLRDYTTYTNSELPINPYTISNYLFLGDDTRSARGSFDLQNATLATSAAAPEPTTLALMTVALLGIPLLARRRRPTAWC